MRAKFINEVQNFTQGGNPYTKLGIGVIKIKDLEPKYYPYINNYLLYKNRIEDTAVHIAERGNKFGKKDINTTLCGIEDWFNYYYYDRDNDKINCTKCIAQYRELKIN